MQSKSEWIQETLSAKCLANHSHWAAEQSISSDRPWPFGSVPQVYTSSIWNSPPLMQIAASSHYNYWHQSSSYTKLIGVTIHSVSTMVLWLQNQMLLWHPCGNYLRYELALRILPVEWGETHYSCVLKANTFIILEKELHFSFDRILVMKRDFKQNLCWLVFLYTKESLLLVYGRSSTFLSFLKQRIQEALRPIWIPFEVIKSFLRNE